ncbi:MAG: DNA polymerase III subunit delta [Saccharospirillum sp.]
MKLSAGQFQQHLAKGLPPLLWISGDEPLLVMEAADQARRAAREAGITDRQVFHADKSFDWQTLLEANQSLSLFGDRQLLELRLEGKLNDAGRKALVAYASSPNPDNLLLIVSEKIEAAQSRAKWFTQVSDSGAWLPVWPVDRSQLPGWLRQRLKQNGLSIDDDALALLAERVDGNLLAARQEIDKLLLLGNTGNIAVETVLQAVSDSARFTVFDLSDACLSGDLERSQRVLSGLVAEGVETPIILWVLSRDLRSLVQLAQAQQLGQNPHTLFNRLRIFEKQQKAFLAALQRAPYDHWQACLLQCGEVDACIKGWHKGDPPLAVAVLVSQIARPDLSQTLLS